MVGLAKIIGSSPLNHLLFFKSIRRFEGLFPQMSGKGMQPRHFCLNIKRAIAHEIVSQHHAILINKLLICFLNLPGETGYIERTRTNFDALYNIFRPASLVSVRRFFPASLFKSNVVAALILHEKCRQIPG